MHVVFTKKRDARHFPPWVAHVGKRRIVGSHLGSDLRGLPHDIVTLVVERELGIREGFYGTVAAGGVFRSMAATQKPSRRRAIARNRPAIVDAEHTVHAHWDRWLAGEDTPCRPALDDARARWMALPPGGTLALGFLDMPAHPARAR